MSMSVVVVSTACSKEAWMSTKICELMRFWLSSSSIASVERWSGSCHRPMASFSRSCMICACAGDRDRRPRP
eukprot:4194152-Heterocapsa_arctica.AAC.1